MDTEEIAQITVKGESEGMDKVKSDIDGVTKAQSDLATQSSATATVTETAAKKHLDASSAYDKLHNSLDGTAGATAAFATRQNLINTALSQGHITQAQASADLDLLAERYPKASQAQDILANKTISLSSIFHNNAAEGTKAAEIATLLEARELQLASSVGLVGEALSIVGPVGLAVTATIGAMIVGIDQLVGSANRMGEVALKLNEISSATGLSTNAVQALSSAGVEFGMTTEQTGRFLDNFTRQLDGAHDGAGNLYTQIQKINPALASELSATKSSSDALNVLAKAFGSATDQAARLALVKAAGAPRGDEGSVGQFLGSLADKGSVEAVTEEVNKLDLITKEQIASWSKLGAQITESADKAKNNIASIFTGPVLDAELNYYQNLLNISRVLKDSGLSDGLNRLSGTPSSFGSGAVAPINGYGGSAPNYKAPSTLPQAPNFDATFGSFEQGEKGFSATIEAVNGSIGDQIAKQKLLVSALGGAADATDKMTLKELELQKAFEQGQFNTKQDPQGMAGAAAAQNQLNIENEIAQAQDRQKANAASLADVYGGVSQATARTLDQLNGQLEVAQAITGQDQQQAQYQANINDSSAVFEEAEQIAAAKLAISQAAATSSVEKQAQSLRDSTALIKAQQTGTEAIVASSIAYRNAINSGADAEAAAALSSATLANYAAKAAASTDQMALAAKQAADAMDAANQSAFQAASNTPGMVGGGNTGGYKSNSGTFNPTENTQSGDFVGSRLSPLLDAFIASPANSLQGAANNLVGKGDYSGALAAVKNFQGVQQFSLTPYSHLATNPVDVGAQMDSVDTITQLQNAKTNDKGTQVSNLQSEMAWLNTLPETIARDQKIVSLQQSIDQLKNATNANTAATEATLNPLYSQGHGALAIGYYKAAGGLDVTAQGPGSGDTIPFRAMVNGGERIQITPAGSAGSNDNTRSQPPVVVQHFDLSGVSTNNARRSIRQFSQGFGQSAAALR